jgi:hypothetical protein
MSWRDPYWGSMSSNDIRGMLWEESLMEDVRIRLIEQLRELVISGSERMIPDMYGSWMSHTATSDSAITHLVTNAYARSFNDSVNRAFRKNIKANKKTLAKIGRDGAEMMRKATDRVVRHRTYNLRNSIGYQVERDKEEYRRVKSRDGYADWSNVYVGVRWGVGIGRGRRAPFYAKWVNEGHTTPGYTFIRRIGTGRHGEGYLLSIEQAELRGIKNPKEHRARPKMYVELGIRMLVERALKFLDRYFRRREAIDDEPFDPYGITVTPDEPARMTAKAKEIAREVNQVRQELRAAGLDIGTDVSLTRPAHLTATQRELYRLKLVADEMRTVDDALEAIGVNDISDLTTRQVEALVYTAIDNEVSERSRETLEAALSRLQTFVQGKLVPSDVALTYLERQAPRLARWFLGGRRQGEGATWYDRPESGKESTGDYYRGLWDIERTRRTPRGGN